MFPENFHFGQERRIIPKICQYGGGEVAVLNGGRASFFKTFIFFFQIRMKNGTKNMWDYPTSFLWDYPTFFSIYPTSIPQKGVVHFCLSIRVKFKPILYLDMSYYFVALEQARRHGDGIAISNNS